MIKERKHYTEMIIGVMKSGARLKSNEIADRLHETSGIQMKIPDISSILSRIGDPIQCNLGYFIQKTADGKSYVFSFVDEILSLSEAQLYGLTRKKGPRKFSLEQALEIVPELQKYIQAPIRMRRKKAADKAVKRKIVKRGAKRKRGRPRLSKTKHRMKISPPAVQAVTKMSDFEDDLIKELNKLGGLKVKVKVSFQFKRAGKT